MTRRAVFYVSDGTGITAEMLGRSLLTQFDNLDAAEFTLPFVDTPEKARDAAAQIIRAAKETGMRPLVFGSLVDEKIDRTLKAADCFYVDCFDSFIRPLEKELGMTAAHGAGRAHGMRHAANYLRRIDALNFTMAHDDGGGMSRLHDADIILIGISRCGKTPTCLYLALHFGVFAANYPLIPEDLESDRLPPPLKPHHQKLYGLTITAPRLAKIRDGRRPGSRYADPRNCESEIRRAESLMRAADVSFLDVTSRSIEELSAKILQDAGLTRHII